MKSTKFQTTDVTSEVIQCHWLHFYSVGCSRLIPQGSKPFFYYVQLIRSTIFNSRPDQFETCDRFNPGVPRPHYFWHDNEELCQKVKKYVNAVFGRT